MSRRVNVRCLRAQHSQTAYCRTLKALFVVHEEKELRNRQSRVFLTSQDAGQVDHSHLKPLVDQFQRDPHQQLHHQVAHNVLHTGHRDQSNNDKLSQLHRYPYTDRQWIK